MASVRNGWYGPTRNGPYAPVPWRPFTREVAPTHSAPSLVVCVEALAGVDYLCGGMIGNGLRVIVASRDPFVTGP